MNTRSGNGRTVTDEVLESVNRVLASSRLDGGDQRWLEGDGIEVLVGPTGDETGDCEELVLTIAVRKLPDVSLTGTVVELTDEAGRVHRTEVDAFGQAVLPQPRGAFRLALAHAAVGREPAEVEMPTPAPTPLRPRRRVAPPRFRALVPTAAAVVAALVLIAGPQLLPGRVRAVASVNIHPADCRNTTGTSGPNHVVVAAVWAGEEQKLFRRVLEAFRERTGVEVTFATNTDKANRDIGATLDDFLAKGCPPDVALLPQPGLLRRLAGTGKLLPVDDATAQLIQANYSRAWQDEATVSGSSYGVWFKSANKSMIWYDVQAFAKAGITEPPKTWDDLKRVANQLVQAGITPFSVGGKDGWTLTDWFENVYLRMYPDRYKDLSEHRIRWTDESVQKALAKLNEIFAMPGWVAPNALGTSYEESVQQVFGRERKAAMVFEGDFVANEIATTGAKRGIDAKNFAFPQIGDESSPVVGSSSPSNDGQAVGGDVAVLMRDTPEAKRLLQFLATPEAAAPWLRAGDFTTPNIKVDQKPQATVTDDGARAVVAATQVNFDLSDLQCPAFGADPRRGMWPILQDFLKDHGPVFDIAQRLEGAWFAPPGTLIPPGQEPCPQR